MESDSEGGGGGVFVWLNFFSFWVGVEHGGRVFIALLRFERSCD